MTLNECIEAYQEASKMISKARTHTLKPFFVGMDGNVEFAWPSDPMIGEHSLGFSPNERLMPLIELVASCGGKVDTTFFGT